MFLTPKEQLAIIKKGTDKIVDEPELLKNWSTHFKSKSP